MKCEQFFETNSSKTICSANGTTFWHLAARFSGNLQLFMSCFSLCLSGFIVANSATIFLGSYPICVKVWSLLGHIESFWSLLASSVDKQCLLSSSFNLLYSFIVWISTFPWSDIHGHSIFLHLLRKMRISILNHTINAWQFISEIFCNSLLTLTKIKIQKIYEHSLIACAICVITISFNNSGHF